MKKNYSPWIHQLEKTREVKVLNENKNTDIVIVGAGIAGVITSYFVLKNTDNKVILIDANLAGHGASGHNAGQLTTYFERPLADIATEFGVDMACSGQKDVESAWDILEELQKEIDFKTPIYDFTGYAGLSELKQVLIHLADNMIRYDGGLKVERMLIADNFKNLQDIPEIYSHLYEVTTQENIFDLLETENKSYIATLAYKKGATNSARICEEVLDYILEKYQDRFEIFENSPVESIILNQEEAIIEVKNKESTKDLNLVEEKIKIENNFKLKSNKIISKKIILCTNGFEGFNIINNHGGEINNKFHSNISGRVNYMSAYLDQNVEEPIAISYFPKEKLIDADNNTLTGEQYFYMTRRPHVHNGEEMGLISTGGPEKILTEGEIYNRDDTCEDWAEKDINNFLKHNYKKHKGDHIEYDFCWHGLLGYTANGIRMIGFENNNTNLLYNLGCNGIGIMPSIFGAKKISEMLNDTVFEKSIFDPSAI